MHVSQLGKWNRYQDIKLITDTTLIEVMRYVTKLLIESNIQFAVYGSSANKLELDEEELSDYDIYVADPIGMLNYLLRELHEKFPLLTLEVIGASHPNTIRLRSTKFTMCDITYVPVTMMNFILKGATKLADANYGYVVGETFLFLDLLKFILNYNVLVMDFANIPSCVTKKWKGGIEQIDEMVNDGLRFYDGGASSPNNHVIIKNNVTYSGLIGIQLWRYALGNRGVTAKCIDGESVQLSFNGRRGPLISYPTTIIPEKDVEVQSVYNDIFHNLVYNEETTEWHYNTNVLPPQYHYADIDVEGVVFRTILPYFMCAESIMFGAFKLHGVDGRDYHTDLLHLYTMSLEVITAEWTKVGEHIPPKHYVMRPIRQGPIIKRIDICTRESIDTYRNNYGHNLSLNVSALKKVKIEEESVSRLFSAYVISKTGQGYSL